MKAINKVRAKLDAGKLILMDGAKGTELTRRGVDTSLPLWSARALIDQPELVRAAHEEYIRAGADIVVANTYMTARCTLVKAGYGELADELPDRAITLLLEAIENEGATGEVVPAGSLSPLSDCLDPEDLPPEELLAREHEEHAVRQAVAGAEMLFCETMITVGEAVIALRAARATGLPALVSFVARDARHLLSGETLDTAVRAVEPLEPLAIAINCCSIAVIDNALSNLRSLTNRPIGAYPHLGKLSPRAGWAPRHAVSPAEFAKSARGWIKKGVQLIGGCCGTTPDFVKTLKDKLFNGEIQISLK